MVPATANIVAKAAVGLADEIVSTVLLAFDGPIIVAPAMNVEMWAQTQKWCGTSPSFRPTAW